MYSAGFKWDVFATHWQCNLFYASTFSVYFVIRITADRDQRYARRTFVIEGAEVVSKIVTPGLASRQEVRTRISCAVHCQENLTCIAFAFTLTVECEILDFDYIQDNFKCKNQLYKDDNKSSRRLGKSFYIKVGYTEKLCLSQRNGSRFVTNRTKQGNDSQAVMKDGSVVISDYLKEGEYNIFVLDYRCKSNISGNSNIENCMLPLKTILKKSEAAKGIDLESLASSAAQSLYDGLFGAKHKKKGHKKGKQGKKSKGYYSLDAMDHGVAGTTYTVTQLRAEKGKRIYKFDDCETRYQWQKRGSFKGLDSSGCLNLGLYWKIGNLHAYIRPMPSSHGEFTIRGALRHNTTFYRMALHKYGGKDEDWHFMKTVFNKERILGYRNMPHSRQIAIRHNKNEYGMFVFERVPDMT